MFIIYSREPAENIGFLNSGVYPSLNRRELNDNHSWSNHFCSVNLHALLEVRLGVVGWRVCVCVPGLLAVTAPVGSRQDPPGRAGKNCVMLLYKCRGDCCHSTATWRPRFAYRRGRPAFPFRGEEKRGNVVAAQCVCDAFDVEINGSASVSSVCSCSSAVRAWSEQWQHGFDFHKL